MIVVTGASGFIGKHLVSSLIEKFNDKNVIALTSKPISKCAYILHENYQYENDVFIKRGFEDIEIIVHAGAYTPKNSTDANNIALCNSNIFNTEKLLNTCFPNLKKIIYLSTLDVYDNDSVITENTLEKPTSLYGQSKLYSEKMIESWCKEKKISAQILRVGHVYGPGEEGYKKIIPITIQKILKGEKISIWGTGEELRSFIYVKDVVEAIVNAISIENNVGVINLVGGNPISINNLVKKIIKLSNIETETEKIETNIKGKNYIFDNTKMLKLLLSKETALDKGLKEEIEYMKNIYH
jgi:nucleoside-diphosphate-sugar epimerase